MLAPVPGQPITAIVVAATIIVLSDDDDAVAGVVPVGSAVKKTELAAELCVTRKNFPVPVKVIVSGVPVTSVTVFPFDAV
jgi:hypothetical protein